MSSVDHIGVRINHQKILALWLTSTSNLIIDVVDAPFVHEKMDACFVLEKMGPEKQTNIPALKSEREAYIEKRCIMKYCNA